MTMPPAPGDFAVVSMGGQGGKLISLMESIAYRRHPIWWDHAFIYTGGGQVVQAEPGGAQQAPVGSYGHTIWSTGLITLTDVQRAKITASARWYAGQKVGYSWADYAAIAAHRFRIPVPGLRDFVADSGRMICSQLVDQCYRDAGVQLFTDERWTGYVTPYDLGRLCQVLAGRQARTPQPGPPAS